MKDIQLGEVTLGQLLDAQKVVLNALAYINDNKDSANREARENAHLALMAIAMNDMMTRPLIGSLAKEISESLEKEEKLRALSEAVRVTKPGGHILVAYCMNEPTVIQYVFGLNHLHEVMDLNMLTADWHCISEPKDLFEMVRTEEIAELDATLPVKRIKLVATDGATDVRQLAANLMMATCK